MSLSRLTSAVLGTVGRTMSSHRVDGFNKNMTVMGYDIFRWRWTASVCEFKKVQHRPPVFACVHSSYANCQGFLISYTLLRLIHPSRECLVCGKQRDNITRGGVKIYFLFTLTSYTLPFVHGNHLSTLIFAFNYLIRFNPPLVEHCSESGWLFVNVY